MLEEIIKLHKKFNELYDNGLIGVSDDYVQVDLRLFKELVGDDTVYLSRPNGGIELTVDKSVDNHTLKIITLL